MGLTSGAKVSVELVCSVGRYSRLELLYILGAISCSLGRAAQNRAEQAVQQNSSSSNMLLHGRHVNVV